MRSRHKRTSAAILLCTPLFAAPLASVGGCAVARQEQYYIAFEPDTKTAALYRVVVNVEGMGLVEYKLSQGYVPASVVDSLTGNLSEPSDLYSPTSEAQERSKLVQDIEKQRSDRLIDLAGGAATPENQSMIKDTVLYFGALQAAAALDTSSQVSIGQSGTSDVYSYRKLVFFASTKVINIDVYAGELDAIEKSSSDLAHAIKAGRQDEANRVKAKKAERDRRLGAVSSLITTTKGGDLTKWTGTDYLGLFATARGVVGP